MIRMVGVEEQLLRDIANRRRTRADVAVTYAFAIRQADEVDFARVNKAIVERWSFAALEWIKDKAWRHVQRGRR